ncbi:hypothetical protein [Actinoallomurus soli]|uniref:hypothetical protein n=1 Tax=Actinoallomurus soli TaxID=2952535 RepID=UPI002092B598|nr:hypothetical protein [Actinoallomurus soli]MCO5968795.1 hypothetical protein [Actinoallomurus soli]
MTLNLTRPQGFAIGGAYSSAFVGLMLLVQLPEGHPEKIREAAQIWRRIGGRVDEGLSQVRGAAQAALTVNGGHAIDEYRKFWSEGLAPYPPQVTAYATKLAKAMDDYAAHLDRTRKTLWEMAIISWAESLMFGVWAELGGTYMWLLRRAARRIQAKAVLRLLEYVLGSTLYAVADEGITDLVKLAWDDDQGPLSEHLERMGKNFLAAMAFYSMDPANPGFKQFDRVVFQKKVMGPGGDPEWVVRNKVAQKYFWYVFGSSVFTATSNFENDPGALIDDPTGLLPTWQQMIGKFGVATAQQGKGWRR